MVYVLTSKVYGEKSKTLVCLCKRALIKAAQVEIRLYCIGAQVGRDAFDSEELRDAWETMKIFKVWTNILHSDLRLTYRRAPLYSDDSPGVAYRFVLGERT